MNKLVIAAAVALLLTGCANKFTPPVSSGIHEYTVNTSYDETWRETVRFFANQNTPIKVIDKESGLLSTDYHLKLSKGYVDCGSYTYDTSVNWKVVTGNVNVFLEPMGDNQTKVRVNLFADATYVTTNLWTGVPEAHNIRCESTGVFENKYSTFIK